MVYKPKSGRDFYDDQYESDKEGDLNNHIVFSPEKFWGRKEELQTLKNLFSQLYCYDSDSDQLPLCPMAIIKASSGTGKSALVRRFIDNLQKDVNEYTVCYIHGRFERTCTDPFSAIIEALDNFFQLMMLHSNDRDISLSRIQTAITESLATETSSLTALIPSLEDVLRGEKKDKSTVLGASIRNGNIVSSDSNSGLECPNSWNRIRYLFKILFCAICTKEYPLVMFLDDC